MVAANSQSRPTNEASLQCATTSIATTPVAASTVSSNAGLLQRVTAAAAGTTSGTIAIAVSINNGSDVTSGLFTIPAGTGVRAGTVMEFNLIGTTNPAPFVNEGDIITFTPSGGGGASIPGAFGAVIRSI
jgi:hypothetical protein